MKTRLRLLLDVQYKYKNRNKGIPEPVTGLSELGRQWSSSSSLTSLPSPVTEFRPIVDPAPAVKSARPTALPIVAPKPGDVANDSPVSPSVAKMREMFQKSP